MSRFEAERLRCVAMPLGGVGTGNLAICGDGSLRQWQIHNRVNHIGYIPYGFFAVRWRTQHVGNRGVVLQTRRFWDDAFEPPPTTSDHFVPPELIRSLRKLPLANETTFEGDYPVAELRYDLGDSPLGARMQAWSPMLPGDAEESAYPVAVFDLELTNHGATPLHCAGLASLQNAVGWDGASLIRGIENSGYGGNVNEPSAHGVRLHNPSLSDDHPGAGEMMLAGVGGSPFVRLQWEDPEDLWRGFVAGRFGPAETPPSAPGRTWNAALGQAVDLAPGESRRLSFVMAWHFPNRYVDWAQWESLLPTGKSRLYLGNHYCRRGAPSDWIRPFLERLDELRARTWAYRESYRDLPGPIQTSVLNTAANLRTNVCLRTEDGRFYGFEGGAGASTWEGIYSTGGCCPMSCTHVWNYEQGLVQLWPELFRSMRETDWLVNLSPEGRLPHRVTLPVYVRKLWDVSIGGPEHPALDGLFAAILKTCQLAGGETSSTDWLASVWPSTCRAMQWVMDRADEQGDGVLRGEQPNTYDIHLYGTNTFIGSQYLAALLAMERMADLLGEPSSRYRSRFDSGFETYDRLCFNGEYFVQRVPEDCDAPYQFGTGCATDQLLGQWWAHHLDLGYVLPEAHVRSACQAIYRRNFRPNFEGFAQAPRVFASDDEPGLLVCTYPDGERPKVPLLYSDEVWTGLEYATAALFLYEGMREEALQLVSAVRRRYDGARRNPFNEVECGDHYIRALSAWSLPKAWRSGA